jgi:1D-myo-inositol-tetrakisphosphate 5-kinase/inositol-polyphosphate multikinase
MADDSIPFQHQVGGHPGLRATADGSRIIKQSLPSERHFYQSVVSAHDKGFKLLSKHVPAFYGVTPADTDGKDQLFPHSVAYVIMP